MSSIIEWVSDNAHWIFDGIGVTVLIGIVGVFSRKRKDKSNSIRIAQKGGKGSTNIQNNNIGSGNNE